MHIANQQGAHNTATRDKNRKRVWDYYAKHPTSTQKIVAEALGLHINSVNKAVQAIRAGWKPAGHE